MINASDTRKKIFDWIIFLIFSLVINIPIHKKDKSSTVLLFQIQY
jgi:hypothetical protein